MYNIFEITFYKVDEDGEEIKDKNGNIKLYQPKGRWKAHTTLRTKKKY